MRIGNVAKAGDLHTLSFSGYQGCEYCKGWKVSDFIIFRTPRLLGLQKVQNLKVYHFQDIKVERAAKVAKGGDFQALSFSGYQGCQDFKSCKILDFSIFRIPLLEGFQSLRLYHFQDIKVARVAKFQTLSFSG